MIATISIFTTVFGNFALHKIIKSNQSGFRFLTRKNSHATKTSVFMSNKLAGFLILGLIPGLIVFLLFPSDISQLGFSFGKNSQYWHLFALPVVIVGLNYFLAKKPNTMKRYPEMRFKEWTKSKLAVLISGWTVYLFAYEFLFRGLLFFSVYHSNGLAVSIAVNIFLYSAVHFPKGKAEMAGAIPFGILLCYMSLLTESILLPFLIHLSLAISTDFFSIYHNPEMKIIRSRNLLTWSSVRTLK